MADKQTKGPSQDQLDAEEAKTLKRFLEEKGVAEAVCELCGASQWGIEYHLVSPMAISRSGPFFAGRHYPSAPLICRNCGNTKLINIMVAGLRRAPRDGE
jgi:hypothetical protein